MVRNLSNGPREILREKTFCQNELLLKLEEGLRSKRKKKKSQEGKEKKAPPTSVEISRIKVRRSLEKSAPYTRLCGNQNLNESWMLIPRRQRTPLEQGAALRDKRKDRVAGLWGKTHPCPEETSAIGVLRRDRQV